MRMKRQLRKMSSSSIMHHPPPPPPSTVGLLKDTDRITERRTSSNSDSSVEPMEISSSVTHTTSSPDVNNSSLLVHNHHPSSDEEEQQLHSQNRRRRTDDDNNNQLPKKSGLEDDLHNNNSLTKNKNNGDTSEYTIVRRDNLRSLDHPNLTIMRKKGRYSNNSHNHHQNHHNLDEDDNEEVDKKGLLWPLSDLVSATQLELTKHIRLQQSAVNQQPPIHADHNNHHHQSNHNRHLDNNNAATAINKSNNSQKSTNSPSDDSHPQIFTCRICSKVLSSASSLDRHILVHSGERPFTCKYCHLTFTTNGNMHRHMRTHKMRVGGKGNAEEEDQAYDSDDDGGSTDSSASSSHNNNKNKINININNNSAFKLLSQKRKSMDDLNEEDVDDDEDNDIDGEMKHNEDGSRIVNRKRKIRSINNNNVLMNNNNLNMQKFCCPVCVRNDFPSMSTLETHLDREHPNVVAKCRHCATVFKSHKLLNSHRCLNSMNNNGHGRNQQITPGFKDLTFFDFSSDKFPIIAKSICEQSIRTPIAQQKFECPKCYRAFPCDTALDIHLKDCGSSMDMSLHSDGQSAYDFSKLRRHSASSCEEDVKRDNFFANLDLQNKSIVSTSSSNNNVNNNNLNSSIGQLSPHSSSNSSTPTSPTMSASKQFHQKYQQSMDFHGRHPMNTFDLRKHFQNHDSKDLADIESIINVTSSGGFLRHLDRSTTTTASSSNKSVDLNSSLNSNKGGQGEEEEAQDAFTSEFRKMKLRGEFPCKLCTAVYPNLRALKGHNRVHLSAAGSGPYRCNMCPYSIHDKAALIRHMRTHNGDRPYECALCNYAFTTKANCERHLRNRHAKTTRDEIKRSIIYHPSEDSSCDDPHKKMQMFSALEMAAQMGEEDSSSHHHHPVANNSSGKEHRTSTPVSYLKERLLPPVITSPTMVPQLTHHQSPLSMSQMQKIQVKSLEKLVKPMRNEKIVDESDSEIPIKSSSARKAIDLSMDALDLSKKPILDEKLDSADSRPSSPAPSHPTIPQLPFGMPKFDMSLFEKNQLLMAQHQLLNETLPKMDPGNYFQQLYRNFMFPAGFPFLFQNGLFGQQPPSGDNPAIPNPMLDIKNFMQSTGSSMSGGSAMMNPANLFSATGNANPILHSAMTQSSNNQTSSSQLKSQLKQNDLPAHLKSLPRTGTPTMSSNSQGSVKMVIKNGVLMPKQKQRRYRTERPFACEHCSARFTLRSNMERHIKQQHPQYWAQRQRSGHQLMRRGHHSGGHSISPSPTLHGNSNNSYANIPDEVKFAILNQQLSRDNKLPFNLNIVDMSHYHELEKRMKEDEKDLDMRSNHHDDDEDEDVDEEEEDDNLIIDEDSHQDEEEKMMAAKKVADSILERIKSETGPKEEDLASISKLVDNATSAMPFKSYFGSDPNAATSEQSDEEGLVASGSASESNNSGAEEPGHPTNSSQKKKSAYSLAPNRVSCPYCQRMFPWSSSLRRHILTHTGQKPFKCSHCPLLFTTKSNCDRHLLRKHGNVESAVSLYMPIDENIPEPVMKKDSSVEREKEEIMTSVESEVKNEVQIPSVNVQQLKNTDGASLISSDLPFKCHLCDSSFPERLNCLDHIKLTHHQEYELLVSKGAIETDVNAMFSESAEDEDKSDTKGKYPDYANRKVICAFCVRRFWSTEDLRRHMRTHSGERPFQCDVCLRKFTLKHSMLRHQKKHNNHGTNLPNHSANSASDMSDDESGHISSNTNRTPNPKIVNGEKSPLNRRASSPIPTAPVTTNTATNQNYANIPNLLKINELLSKDWKLPFPFRGGNMTNHEIPKSGFPPGTDLSGGVSSILGMLMGAHANSGDSDSPGSDLIGNLLGINDQRVLNKVLQSSPDEAAKLLGVEK